MQQSLKSKKSWLKIIESYEQSNLGKAEFCKENKLRVNQFYYWCNKLRPDLKSELHQIRMKGSSFIPIKQPESNFKFNLNGVELSFAECPNPSWFAQLLKSMDSHGQHR